MTQEGQSVTVQRDMNNVAPPLLRDLLFKRDGAPVNMWAKIRRTLPGRCLTN